MDPCRLSNLFETPNMMARALGFKLTTPSFTRLVGSFDHLGTFLPHHCFPASKGLPTVLLDANSSVKTPIIIAWCLSNR